MRLNSIKLKRMDEVLQQEIDSEHIPGAAYAVGIGDEIIQQNALGYAENRNGVVRRMTMDTVFDLASLTKVTATLPSILQLVDEGRIRLNDPVGLFLSDFANHDKSSVTILHLLTHSAGLISHRNYYDLASSREELVKLVLTEPLQGQPGSQVLYSDLGFILLAEVLEAVTGQRIDQYAEDHVFSRLGMGETGYCPPEEFRGRIAATEEFPDVGVKVGVVHDENTDAMGGVSGHAGLFAPLSDMVKYVQNWLAVETPMLSQAVRMAAVHSYTATLNGERGLGWTCRGDSYDHMGDLWPGTTVGHTGFTGTSLAFDPVSKVWCVLLTNDVHYGREHRAIIRLRPRIHNIIAAAWTV